MCSSISIVYSTWDILENIDINIYEGILEDIEIDILKDILGKKLMFSADLRLFHAFLMKCRYRQNIDTNILKI